ncbi:hypothetical protein AHMF7605_18315 [Adhaeribacter arboris]|uniref:Uncharacterized protein n=1 Tax=Adhaeribacter arboris TaxID=2072846 RepID=A0A2T2YIJ2_9BACT|nr:hypothetical protein [Adhaeribacter arboris]PSR55320.1 hypothetical protein AHMF7605_18315 [Adhaeribacter arboris]
MEKKKPQENKLTDEQTQTRAGELTGSDDDKVKRTMLGTGASKSDENWDQEQRQEDERDLEDRDTNDGDANTENNF